MFNVKHDRRSKDKENDQNKSIKADKESASGKAADAKNRATNAVNTDDASVKAADAEDLYAKEAEAEQSKPEFSALEKYFKPMKKT